MGLSANGYLSFLHHLKQGALDLGWSVLTSGYHHFFLPTDLNINSSTNIHSEGNVIVSANNDYQIVQVGGSVGGSSNVGVGAGASVHVLDNTTLAYVDDNAVIDADATRSAREEWKSCACAMIAALIFDSKYCHA